MRAGSKRGEPALRVNSEAQADDALRRGLIDNGMPEGEVDVRLMEIECLPPAPAGAECWIILAQRLRWSGLSDSNRTLQRGR